MFWRRRRDEPVDEPTEPTEPTEPAEPTEPTEPTEPATDERDVEIGRASCRERV